MCSFSSLFSITFYASATFRQLTEAKLSKETYGRVANWNYCRRKNYANCLKSLRKKKERTTWSSHRKKKRSISIRNYVCLFIAEYRSMCVLLKSHMDEWLLLKSQWNEIPSGYIRTATVLKSTAQKITSNVFGHVVVVGAFSTSLCAHIKSIKRLRCAMLVACEYVAIVSDRSFNRNGDTIVNYSAIVQGSELLFMHGRETIEMENYSFTSCLPFYSIIFWVFRIIFFWLIRIKCLRAVRVHVSNEKEE